LFSGTRPVSGRLGGKTVDLIDWRHERSERHRRRSDPAMIENRHVTIRPGPARWRRLRCGPPALEDNLEMINERQ
jgi:hypothetical protein